MNDLIIFASGLIIGAGAIITRRLRLEAALLEAARVALDAERERNAELCRELDGALVQNQIAATQIRVLAGTLAAAVGEVQHERAAHGGVRIGENVAARFCWN